MENLLKQISCVATRRIFGRVASVSGLLVEVAGPVHEMGVGAHLEIETTAEAASGETAYGEAAGTASTIAAEVIGFRDETALVMPFGNLDGVKRGCRVFLKSSTAGVRPTKGWLGRVVNAFGDPIDGKGPIERGPQTCALRHSPPKASERQRVGAPLDLGVRALNTFITCCAGQRMGIFAGSGVGKSVLLSMLARYTQSDVSVIGLIGERGREVQEFIEDDLGEEGLKRSVVVVSTSDEPALMRRQAAYLTLSISEYFRDCGQDVLCLMDSVTRFAQAQREIGLSIGEPPTAKGYTPTVFTELPRLLERAGPGVHGSGSITGIFTVLVEGDNHNEPVADAVRGILDGHIVMERSIAERGRYPAINVLKSVSRTMPRCVPEDHLPTLKEARTHMATFSDMEELIRLGAYRKGTDPAVDLAIDLNGPLETFLSQRKEEKSTLAEGYSQLAHILESSVS